MDELVASFIGVHTGEAFTFQAEDFAAMGAGRNFDLGFTVDSGHFGLEAEDGIIEGDMELVGDVEAVAVKFGVLFLFDKDDEVAGGAASFASVTTATDAKLHTFLNTGWDVKRDGLFAIYAALSLTNAAFGGDNGAFAVAGGAGGDGLHLAEEGVADAPHLAATAAGGAGLDALAVFGAGAAAGGAGDVFLYFDVLCDAFGDLLVVEFDLDAEVAASDTAGARGSAAAAAAEEAAEKVVAENITELAEDVVHVHAAAGSAAVAAEAGMSIAVVLGTFIRIAEDFIGFCRFLEFLL